MKKLNYLLVVLLLTTCFFRSNASHLMVAEITWTCIGQDSFMIKLVVYRDCNGITLGSSPINFNCASSGTLITSLLLGVGIPQDITPVCNSSCTRCQSSGCIFPYGIHMYTMQGLVKLNSAGNCCDINISWTQNARNAAITTLVNPGSSDLFIEAKLNRCLNPCDNSPTFTNPPVAILCIGQDYTYNHGARDYDVNSTGGLSDSITYEWGQPLKSEDSAIAYTGNYAYNRSIYFWGFPNEPLPFPRGLHLDTYTGDIQFRPMKAEITVMVVVVNEYRNGVKIGEIRRDMQFNIITCTNNNPAIVTTPNNIRSKSVRYGDTVTFAFSTSDANANDTVTLTWNNTIPGANWTHTNGQFKHPTATLTWIPSSSQISSLPYTFTVTAKDNACTLNAKFTQAYQIRVTKNPTLDIFENHISKSDFKIYPNPASDYVNIVYQGLPKWEGTVILFDQNSKLIYTKSIYFNSGNDYQSLPLKGYSSGMYFLKLQNNSGQTVYKFTINK